MQMRKDRESAYLDETEKGTDGNDFASVVDDTETETDNTGENSDEW